MRGIGYGLKGLAALESAESHPVRAIQIASAADLFIEQEGIVNMYSGDFQDKKYIENAKNELSQTEFEQAVQEGRKMSVKEKLYLTKQISLPLPA